MNILSIQSSVAFGHVGNSAAVFPLQRIGHEVWPINTVQFSNHTGYGQWKGRVFPPEHLAELVDGLNDRGQLARCDAVLSGYLGDAAAGAVILSALARIRAVNPRALYCCDPVMGDEGRGLFVRPGIPEYFATQALPAADIVTPNQFELEVLTARTVRSLDDVLAAARILQSHGPTIVAVTSVRAPAVAEGRLGTVVVTPEGAFLADTPLLVLEPPPNGTGDVFAALFLGHHLSGLAVEEALSLTVSALYAVLENCRATGSRELTLVASQEAFVNPPPAARVTRLS